jgi:hypothetical protein
MPMAEDLCQRCKRLNVIPEQAGVERLEAPD